MPRHTLASAKTKPTAPPATALNPCLDRCCAAPPPNRTESAPQTSAEPVWIRLALPLIQCGLLLAQSGSAFPLAAADNFHWDPRPDFRSAALPVPTSGQTGFTELGPHSTGLLFTNHLSDDLEAGNRILAIGSGVALGDVDGDGWCDIYFCRLNGPNALYRNLGNWKFQDITATAGVACPNQFSTGTVLADLDGDSDLDLLVNAIGEGTRCFFNDGQGRFTERPDSGLVRRYGSTSMALGDIDRDGDLDLYVANYRTTTFKDAPPGLKVQAYMTDGGRVVVTPADRFTHLMSKSGNIVVIEKGEPDFLYINKGNGRFGAVSWTLGAFLDETGQKLPEPPARWGLSVVFRDFNNDLAPDIYVCNDFFYSPDLIWLNDGGVRFRAISPLAVRNISMSAMTIDVADINRDGYDDLFVADMLSRNHAFRQRQRANVLKGELNLPIRDPNFRPENLRNSLHLNRGDGTYAEIAQLCGLDASEWTWSALFLDVDLDGYEDLLLCTGNNHDVLDSDRLREMSSPTAPSDPVARLQRFPRLHTPNLVFQNLGQLQFKETGAAWGFSSTNISQAMAAADLDNDGDLDLVVNNLNAAAGLYRNDANAPRLSVRLKGNPPNTQGIGAKIKISGGPLNQSQEVIAGGHYLSGADPLRVFAGWHITNRFTITVNWRSGKTSAVTNAHPNRIYEIAEPAGIAPRPQRIPAANADPFFLDVSHWLNHIHEDDSLDDFEIQPLLSKRLSHLGPGLCWHDFDRDGRDDLAIAGGRGGRLALFRNSGTNHFQPFPASQSFPPLNLDQGAILAWNRESAPPLILTALSKSDDTATPIPLLRAYDAATGQAEDWLPDPGSMTGPLAAADVDNDGDVDLFVGGRARPRRYPEPVSSLLYLNQGAQWQLDEGNRAAFLNLGLVSGALFSDLDNDGDPDLVLACEWGPLRLFKNNKGVFDPWDPPVIPPPPTTAQTQPARLSQLTGWWNAVAVGDFDEDGRMDLIGCNWGQNTKFQHFLRQPLQIFYADFDRDGTVELIETYFDPHLGKRVPARARDTLAAALPWLKESFPTFNAFSYAGIDEILATRRPDAKQLTAATLDSMLFLNRGDHLETRPLPVETQFSPAFTALVGDADGDGHDDLFLSQNFFDVEIETSRYDAGLGLWLRGDGHGSFTPWPAHLSGVKAYGEQRGAALADFDQDGRIDLAVTQNRAETKLYWNQKALPGLRARLKGPPANPDAIGAILRLKFHDRWGPAREIHQGNGYASQDSPVQILGRPTPPSHLWVRWPGGQTNLYPVPPDALEVRFSSQPTP